MFKNIGKKIQFVAILLAILCFVGFLAFGVLCLIPALEDGADETLKEAGIQAAIISVIAALLSPLTLLALYGFGSLVTAAEKQAEDSREIKEMLRHALSEGCLSDEIARKMGAVQLKLQAQQQAQAAPKMMGQAYAPHAPMQRPVQEPTPAAAPAPVASAPVMPAPAAPAPVAFAPIEPAAPAPEATQAPEAAEIPTTPPSPVKTPTPAAPVAPVAPVAAPAPAVRPKPAQPIAGAKPLQSLHDNDETF